MSIAKPKLCKKGFTLQKLRSTVFSRKLPFNKINESSNSLTFPTGLSVLVPPGWVALCDVGSAETRQQLIWLHPSARKGKGWEGNTRHVHQPRLYGNDHTRSAFVVRAVTGWCVRVPEHVNTQRLETCRGLWQVKWALGWLVQQSRLFDNTTTRWPRRDCDK